MGSGKGKGVAIDGKSGGVGVEEGKRESDITTLIKLRLQFCNFCCQNGEFIVYLGCVYINHNFIFTLTTNSNLGAVVNAHRFQKSSIDKIQVVGDLCIIPIAAVVIENIGFPRIGSCNNSPIPRKSYSLTKVRTLLPIRYLQFFLKNPSTIVVIEAINTIVYSSGLRKKLTTDEEMVAIKGNCKNISYPFSRESSLYACFKINR